MPINPTKSASRILESNPDLATDLMDLIICVGEAGFRDSNEYDEIKDLCWAKIQAGRDARDTYIASRAA
jgi:hypothetical protein